MEVAAVANIITALVMYKSVSEIEKYRS